MGEEMGDNHRHNDEDTQMGAHDDLGSQKAEIGGRNYQQQ